MTRAKKNPEGRIDGTVTPVGWSFWSTALNCWQKWAIRYIEGWEPIKKESHFDVGSAYHLLHEYEGDTELAALNTSDSVIGQLAEGARLFLARMKGAPIPPATEREKVYLVDEGLLKGIYSARPDQMELGPNGERIVRDFKSLKRIYGNEDKKYRVSGEIIGEIVASGADAAVVDIVTKEARPRVQQLEVKRRPERVRAHEILIVDLLRQMKERLAMMRQYDMERAFPRNLESCCQVKPCEYYARCWEAESTEAKLYRVNDARRSGWRRVLGL